MTTNNPFAADKKAAIIYKAELDFNIKYGIENPEESAKIATEKWLKKCKRLVKTEAKTFGKH